jgi:nitrile hydratase accessory protein
VADRSSELLRTLEDSGIPGDRQPRTFKEPWQAQAFAMAVELSRAGLFTWREWVERFSAEIGAAPQEPGEDADGAYYRQWLTTLEQMIVERQACAPAEIDDRQADWRQAYLHTPHGQPVELENARRHGHATDLHDDDHDNHHHDHPASHAPVMVSPAIGG